MTVLIDAVNGGPGDLAAVHVGCHKAYVEGRTLDGDVCDPCFAVLDFVAADAEYERRCDR